MYFFHKLNSQNVLFDFLFKKENQKSHFLSLPVHSHWSVTVCVFQMFCFVFRLLTGIRNFKQPEIFLRGVWRRDFRGTERYCRSEHTLPRSLQTSAVYYKAHSYYYRLKRTYPSKTQPTSWIYLWECHHRNFSFFGCLPSLYCKDKIITLSKLDLKRSTVPFNSSTFISSVTVAQLLSV